MSKEFWDNQSKNQINMVHDLTIEKKLGYLISYIIVNADTIKDKDMAEHRDECADTIITLANQLEKDLYDMDMIEEAFDGLDIIDEEYFTKYEHWFTHKNKIAIKNNLPVLTGDECEGY